MERRAVSLDRFDAGAIRPTEPARTPLYHQIYLVLRQRIVDGEFADGDILPGEFELAEVYGVSRITAKRALDELAKDGLVRRERGRGTMVSHRREDGPMQAQFEGQLEDLLAMGMETSVDLLEFAYMPASAEVASALDCAPGDEVQMSVRVRSVRGEPFSHLTTYVPGDIGRKFGEKDLAQRPLLALLEKSGVHVDAAEQTITATLADTGTARRLDTTVGAPLIKVVRIVQDIDGRPVEYITALYRPDRYQYHMNLTRQAEGKAKVWSPSRTGYRLT